MLYHQKVKSDLILPGATLINPNEQVDIEIEIGNPPEWVLERAARGQGFYFKEKVMWIHLTGMVLFYIENGNRIVIYLESDHLTEAALRSYLTGSAMALAIMQRGYIPVHGGTVAWEGRGIIISGVSGAGKSTVTMELFHQGCSFVADDMSVINLVEGEVEVFPGIPQQKVCRDVAIKNGLELKELIYIDENRDKFARILKGGYVTEPLPVACMIELIVSENVEQVVYETVTGAERFDQLIRNIYRGEVYQRLENRPERFLMFIKAAAQIPMYRITRPLNGDYVEDIVLYIRKELLHINS